MQTQKLFKVPAEVYKYWRPTGRGRGERREKLLAAELHVSELDEWDQQTSLHDGPVDNGLDVVLSVAGVDDALPLGVLLDIALLKELKAHVRRHRLGTERKQLQ